MKSRVSRESQLLAAAVYRVGDVVVTDVSVRCFDNRNEPDGYAAPGWWWRITGVRVVQTRSGHALRYDAVADSAPEMYHGTIRPKQIARKVK